MTKTIDIEPILCGENYWMIMTNINERPKEKANIIIINRPMTGQ